MKQSKLYNQLVKEEFIDDYIAKTESKYDGLRAWLRGRFEVYAKFESLFKMDMAFFLDGHFVRMFNECGWVTYSSMNTHKTLIKAYMRWYKSTMQEGWIDVKITTSIEQIRFSELDVDNTIISKYIFSFEELQSQVAVLLDNAPIGSSRFDLPVTLIYLAFFGFTLKEAINIRKDDVHPESNTIVYNDHSVHFAPEAMQFINAYKMSEGYEIPSFQTQKYYHYVSSPYLLRTINNFSITESNAKRYISDVKKYLAEASQDVKILGYRGYYWSGVFLRARQYEKENGIELSSHFVDDCQNIFNENYNSDTRSSHLFRTLTNFKQYKDCCPY